jgi:hypothetical protein
MLVTTFGDVTYGDGESLRQWLQAHDIAHRQLRQAVAIQKGAPLGALYLYTKDVDNDWFGRHGLGHLALFRFAPTGSGLLNSLTFSSVLDWGTEQAFYDWHQRHDYVHQQLNAAFGIS